jgi:hypothetical protein
MTVALTSPQTAQTDAPESASDWARALLERQLWVLGQLAEGGLEIARAIERQATGSKEGVRPDLPMAYARVARAVRMTLMLQSKAIEALQAMQSKADQQARSAQLQREFAHPGLVRARKVRIGRIVGRIAWADGQDHERVKRLAREAFERLEQDELYGDILSRPVSEIIALICKDMGLEPDWPRLAEEAWAKAEIAAGGALAALTAPPRPAPANDQDRLAPQAASP